MENKSGKNEEKNIERLSRLAMLSLKEEEKAELSSELEKMLEYISKVKEADIGDINPLVYPSGNLQYMREDEHAEHISHEEAMWNVPNHEGGYVIAPSPMKKKKINN